MSCMWILEDNDIWDLEEHGNKDRLHFKNDLRKYSNGEVLIILFRWVVVEGTGRFFCLFPIYFLDLWFIQPIMCPSIQRREFILYPPTSQARDLHPFRVLCISPFSIPRRMERAGCSEMPGKGGCLVSLILLLNLRAPKPGFQCHSFWPRTRVGMGYRQVVGENDSREDTRAIMSAMNSSHLCQALSEDVVIVCCFVYSLREDNHRGCSSLVSSSGFCYLILEMI